MRNIVHVGSIRLSVRVSSVGGVHLDLNGGSFRSYASRLRIRVRFHTLSIAQAARAGRKSREALASAESMRAIRNSAIAGSKPLIIAACSSYGRTAMKCPEPLCECVADRI